jgi:hypothetical protein
MEIPKKHPGGPAKPLSVNLEILTNLIYLAERTEMHSAQQHHYLDWAARIVKEIQTHPKLYD